MEFQLPSLPILLSSLLLLIMVVKRIQSRNSASKLPPGPWGLPLLGNLHQIIGPLPHHSISKLAKKYGPFMYLRLGQIPTIVVSSPEYAKEVMRTHDVVFASRPRTLISQIIAYGCTDIAFAPYGEYWRQLRKICVRELLSPARVQTFGPARREEYFDVLQVISSKVGSAINLTEMVTRSSYRITARVALGKESISDHDEVISIVEEALKAALGFEFGEVFPSLSFLDWSSRPKYEILRKRCSRIMEKIIKEHIKKNATMSSAEKGSKEEDLLDVLLKYHNNNITTNGDVGFTLTTDNIIAVILDIFTAGSESTALTLDWAMAEMMRNPRVMNKAQNEVREVFGRNGSVDETSINEMKYLKSIVKEILRLHPTAPLLVPRESREKCEINGYEIPMKTRVLVNIWEIGRDPKYWVEPDSFMPERFLDSSIDFKGNNFEYIPFGAGRRICPGISLGTINIELPLALLLYHFDWKLPNGMKPEDLDMTESFGVTVRRKYDLLLIPAHHS
ncbi:cytochrome P450 71D11-like [Humulus lupulus]|uniref:cytochrome P450 71D11-like n=1 Tax=Humulus lupulus TaxID=3486 RepID=UPI002B416EE5|nr:cytochrome P450 71D11-like [Humulus lupulus]